MWRGNEKLKRSHFYGAFNNFVIQFHMIAIGSLNEYTLGEAFWNDNRVGIILRKYSHRDLFTRVLLKIVQWILQSKCWKNIHGRYVVLVLYSYKSNTTVELISWMWLCLWKLDLCNPRVIHHGYAWSTFAMVLVQNKKKSCNGPHPVHHLVVQQ